MQSLGDQFRKVVPVLLIVWLVTTLGLLLAIFASTLKDIPLDAFTNDPNASFNAPFYIGFFSNIGIMIWSAALTLCFYGAWKLNKPVDAWNRQFLLASGIITLMMTVDDLFQLHELVFPKYFNISANMVYLTYMNIYIIYFLRYRRQLMQTDYMALAVAFFFLGLSTVIDVLPLPIEKDTFLEDAMKLLGIVSWTVYYVRTVDQFSAAKETVAALE